MLTGYAIGTLSAKMVSLLPIYDTVSRSWDIVLAHRIAKLMYVLRSRGSAPTWYKPRGVESDIMLLNMGEVVQVGSNTSADLIQHF